MKRLLSLFLIVAIIFSTFAGLQISSAALETTGKCGKNIYWTFEKNTGKLTIYGYGAMDNYSQYGSPFYCCDEIKKITIGTSVTSIGSYAFYKCRGLTSITISDSVTSIGNCAFSGCSGLTSLIIPDNVTTIGASAFYSCSGLTSATIGNSVTDIGYKAFSGCSGLTNVTIPNSVTSIGDNAFSGCSGLTNVTIPNSVTSIGDFAFEGCRGLTSVTIPDSVTSIGYYAFFGCTGLTSVIIPDSVTSIGNYTFDDCRKLTSVTIPDSVTSIGYYAFYNCSNLKTIYGVFNSKAEEYAKSHNITFIGSEHKHNYNKIETVKESTCLVKGEEKYTCRCGDYYTKPLPLVDHNYYKSNTIQSTCIKAGKNTYACSWCGNSYTQTLPLAEHSYKSANTIKKAAYQRNGKIIASKCSVCGAEGSTTTIYAPATIVLSTSTYAYSGKANKPAITVKDSTGSVIDSSNYTVAYSNNINAGTAKVTVTFKGDMYEGSMSKTFKISPKKLTNCYLDTVCSYTGKAIVPVPYYYDHKQAMTSYGLQDYYLKANYKKGTDYNITISGGHKNVGNYTIVIKFKGNYSGTIKKTLQIRPAPVVSAKAVSYSATSIKVNWTKAKNVSGYAVYRYNNSKHKWVKYKNTTKNSMIIPRLSKSDVFVDYCIRTYKKVGNKVYWNDGSKNYESWQYTKPNKPIVKLVNLDFGKFDIKFNRSTDHQMQLSDNKAFSNKGNNICITYRKNGSVMHANQWGSGRTYYVRAREYYYTFSGKLVVGSWSDVKTITTL